MCVRASSQSNFQPFSCCKISSEQSALLTCLRPLGSKVIPAQEKVSLSEYDSSSSTGWLDFKPSYSFNDEHTASLRVGQENNYCLLSGSKHLEGVKVEKEATSDK